MSVELVSPSIFVLRNRKHVTEKASTELREACGRSIEHFGLAMIRAHTQVLDVGEPL